VQGKAEKLLIDARFLVPFLALALFTAKNFVIDGRLPQAFSIVTRDQFLGVIAGVIYTHVLVLTFDSNWINLRHLAPSIDDSHALFMSSFILPHRVSFK
jgi:hypothetical protein